MNLSGYSVQYLKGVGPARAKLFENLGVRTVEDLLYLFPNRYEDRSKLTPIAKLVPGEWQTTSGEILAMGGRRTFYNKKHVLEVEVGDDTGRVKCVWFNQPWLENYIHVGNEIVLHGRVEVFKDRLQLVSPEHEVIAPQDQQLSMGRIVPIYPLTKGMGQRYLRKLMAQALELHAGDLVEVIPAEVLQRQGLEPVSRCIRQLHFPDTEKAQDAADRRVSFEEFFFFQVCVILRRMRMSKQKGFAHKIPGDLDVRFKAGFPFTLTQAQQKAIAQIKEDMASPRPMLRLLQGDVGCGKTVVALFGCCVSLVNGRQSAIMAPTEILARQHFKTLAGYLAGSAFNKARVALLDSTLTKKERKAVHEAIARGDVDIVVGTHALIASEVAFRDLGYVVIDEQHKFGVKQRAILSSKGNNPDVMVMTATPIPRTLCLTLYGDLDVSVIGEKPGGRGEIKTYHCVGDQAEGVYRRVAEWVGKGTQAYIVYPIIEESEKADLKAAVDMYEHFRKNEFKDLRVGLVHGRLPREETRAVMDRFQAHEIDILVTTTVLEVGIDVAGANVMVIEHAERFGLSQLHQLRGRIGRGARNAVCILLGDPRTEDGKKRIEAIVGTTDGFRIAEQDLEIRGPGQYFGRHQHGLNELKVVNPLTQLHVLEAARQEAVALAKADPSLKSYKLIRETIHQRYPEYLERVLAG